MWNSDPIEAKGGGGGKPAPVQAPIQESSAAVEMIKRDRRRQARMAGFGQGGTILAGETGGFFGNNNLLG